jgi:replicative DNA helicase
VEPAVTDLIQSCIVDLWKIATQSRDLNIWKLEDAMLRFIEARMEGKRAAALDVGIDDLDREFRGLFTFGGYTMVAARPSMGKSTFCRWTAKMLAQAGTSVGFISIEETEDKIAGNIISSETEIENTVLAYSDWNTLDQTKISVAAEVFAGKPFYGIDSAFTLPDVLTAAEILVTQHQCRVLFIDHIHLIENQTHAESREQEISKISNALKAFFKRTGVVGIVAAQLSRPPKMIGEPPLPHLTDLRHCGGLEEHADAVLMLHRRDYYFRNTPGYVGDRLVQVLIRKNRNGQVGAATLEADLPHQRFLTTQTEVPDFT